LPRLADGRVGRLEDGSKVVDNDSHRSFRRSVMILALPKNARRNAAPLGICISRHYEV
jgi:hypothetical protein